MSRKNRFQTGSSNPAAKFFQWKSDHQKFAYYDKAEEKNIFVDFPFKFLALVSYKTVKGYNSKRKSGIGANEVKSIAKNSKEVLKVHYFDEGKTVIAEGRWQEIKDTVDLHDGKFTESVYAMLPDGELVNIQINGAGLSTWYEFQKNQQDKLFDNWVVVNGFKEGKSGSVEYTYPVFEFGETLSRSEQKLAEQCDAKIDTYEKSYFGGEQPASKAFDGDRSNSEVNKYEAANATATADLDDLDF